MTPQEAQKEFEGQLAALELVVMYLGQAVSLLRRSVEGILSLKYKDNGIVRIVLFHFIVNNLAALFYDGPRNDSNSLTKIAKRFEGYFPDHFFSEYVASMEKFRMKHADDLERIRKNRNLSTAHLGASKKERLGWSPQIAKKLDEILGTQSTVAQNDSLVFITPFQLFDMPIIQEIPQLEKVLEELRFKVLDKNVVLDSLSEEDK